jgi:hypothetical protein
MIDLLPVISCLVILVWLSLVCGSGLSTAISLTRGAIAGLPRLIALLGLLLIRLARIRGLVLGSLISLVSLSWLIHRSSPNACRQGTSFAFAMPAV